MMAVRPGPRWTAWLSVGLATVALHGCVLDAVWPAWAGAAGSPRALQVRTVAVETPRKAAEPAGEAAEGELQRTAAPAPVPPGPSDATLRRRIAHRVASPPPQLVQVLATVDTPAVPAEVAERLSPVPLVATADDLAPAEAAGATGATPPSADATPQPLPDSVPTYRTAPPPATRLAYDLKHGILTGQGEIDWRPAGPRYELKLEGRIASLTLLTQISTGGFDAHGLAPERYTDQRMKRAVNAANLQRGAGKITFSGPDTQYPLLAGTQDRVSWMVQLAAIVNAQPELATAGARVTLFVVGARGEGDVWVFACTGNETVDTGMGPMRAAKFIREPTKPHDTQVEAWLAPQLHGLPAHARLSNGNDGALDLILREVH